MFWLDIVDVKDVFDMIVLGGLVGVIFFFLLVGFLISGERGLLEGSEFVRGFLMVGGLGVWVIFCRLLIMW